MAGLFSKIASRFRKTDIDWDDLEEELIGGDLGVPLAMEIIDDLRDRGRSLTGDDVIAACREEVRKLLQIGRAHV